MKKINLNKKEFKTTDRKIKHRFGGNPRLRLIMSMTDVEVMKHINHQDFSFTEYGTDEGILSMALVDRFKDSSGRIMDKNPKLNNVVKKELKELEVINVKVEQQNIFNDTNTSDITFYLSPISAMMKTKSPEDIAKVMSDQTINIAVVSMPLGREVNGLKGVYYDDLLACLLKYFVINSISHKQRRGNTDGDLIFLKKRSR